MPDISYYITGLLTQPNAERSRQYLGIIDATGTGTVTHTVGDLTLDELVVGNAGGDVKTFLAPGDDNLFLCGTTTPTWADPAGGMAWGRYRFDTSTVMANPGTGKLRLNSGTWAGATEIAISQFSDPGTDVEGFLNMLEAGDQIGIQDRGDATKYSRYEVVSRTDNGVWFSIVVTTVNSGGAVPGNNQSIGVMLFYSGGGGGGGTVTNALNLADNFVVVGDGGTVGVKTIAGIGASGDVLTSNGAGVPPTFQTPSTGNVSGSSLTEPQLIVGDGGSNIRIIASVGLNNTVLHGVTGGDPAFSSVVEDDLALTDISTANSAVGQHGFLRKLSNVATQYMDGTGNWSTPAGSGGNVTTAVTLTDHAVVLGNGSADVTVVSSLGSSGQVLTSNGAGADPSWQSVTGLITTSVDYWDLPTGATNGMLSNVNMSSAAGNFRTPTTTYPPQLTYVTAGALNSTAGRQAITGGLNYFPYNRQLEWITWITTAETTTFKYYIGFIDLALAGGTDMPAQVFVGFRYATTVPDTNWRALVNNGSSSESLDTGILYNGAQTYKMSIRWDGTTSGKITFYIDNALVATSTLDLTSTQCVGPCHLVRTQANPGTRTLHSSGWRARVTYF